MIKEIKKGVYYIGALHWDRKTFDELVYLPDGTTYNAYLVIGEKNIALIDTVDPSKAEELLEDLRKLNLERIDFIVSNHSEQDHSGTIPMVLEYFKTAKIVTNEKGKEFLKEHLDIKEDDKFIVIRDGEEIDLGGKTLKFIFTPWVHWPETMVTYLKEEGILFSCDFFGTHRADDNIIAEEKLIESIMGAKRYYAEIMQPFRLQIKNHIKKLRELDIKIIAPSHGPIYTNPENIINAYLEWVDDKVREKVIILFVSMHNSTRIAVDYMVNRFREKNIEVMPINLSVEEEGKIAMELIDSAGIIFAGPYVLSSLHPKLIYSAVLISALRPKLKYGGIVVSYGWGGMGVENLLNIIKPLNLELYEPIKIRGIPKEKDFSALDNLVNWFEQKIKSLTYKEV